LLMTKISRAELTISRSPLVLSPNSERGAGGPWEAADAGRRGDVT
jgi:hypothetical protein